VVTPVQVSTGNSVVAAAAAGNKQVLAGNSAAASRQIDGGLVKMTSARAVDSGHTENSSAHAEDDGYDGWSEVKSVKSPRRRKTNSADSVEKQQVISVKIITAPLSMTTVMPAEILLCSSESDFR